MTAALGQALQKNTVQPPSPYPTVSVCHYRGGGLTLTVRTETLDKNGYNQTKSNLTGGVEVAGVGDAAYFHATENMKVVIGTFLAHKGTTMLSLTYGGMDAEKAKVEAAETALGTRLVAKL
jgi:hypothetical protein